MKAVRISLLLSILSAIAIPVFAAAQERVDDSHLLTYLFLGTCGLIVLLQLFPVISLIRDLLKGSAEDEMEELKAATSKYQ